MRELERSVGEAFDMDSEGEGDSARKQNIEGRRIIGVRLAQIGGLRVDHLDVHPVMNTVGE